MSLNELDFNKLGTISVAVLDRGRTRAARLAIDVARGDVFEELARGFLRRELLHDSADSVHVIMGIHDADEVIDTCRDGTSALRGRHDSLMEAKIREEVSDHSISMMPLLTGEPEKP